MTLSLKRDLSDNSISIFIGDPIEPPFNLLQLFFSDFNGDVSYVNTFSEGFELNTIEDLCVAVGFMPSKSQARKNGFSGQIPKNTLVDYTFGKKKNKKDVWIYIRGT